MNRNQPWHSYRQVSMQTASPGQLVLLLYDGALRFLEQARLGFACDDPKAFNESINNNVVRAQAIINELSGSLDMRAGGEFSLKLRALYEYLDRRLFESNLHKEKKGIDEAIQRLTVLRESWAEMLRHRADDLPVNDHASALSAAV